MNRSALQPIATDYQGRAGTAVTSVLVELGQVLGEFHDKFVVIGGAVPWLLLPKAQPAHIGTIDIDLNLDPDALGDGQYADLIHCLERAGYDRGGEGARRFQMRRAVKVDEDEPIVVLVDFLMPREAKPLKNDPPLLEDFAVQKADGAAIALKCHVDVRIEGRMPDGRNNSVNLLVATIPASLVMKGYAIVGRDKQKDAYDIYFCVRSFPGGVEALTKECQPLLVDAKARKGFENIASKFRSADDYGPQSIAVFLEESGFAEMSKDQLRQDAHAQVTALMKRLGI